MEGGAIIKAFAGEFLEVLDGFRGHVGPELGHHFSFAGLDHGHFIRCIGGFIHCHGLLFCFLAALGEAERNHEQPTEHYAFHSQHL